MMLTHAIDLTASLSPVPALLGILGATTLALVHAAVAGRRRRASARQKRLRLVAAAAA